jgi:hypothetical protein
MSDPTTLEPPITQQPSGEEWRLGVDLTAAYRLVVRFDIDGHEVDGPRHDVNPAAGPRDDSDRN